MKIGIDCRKIYDVQKQTGGGVDRYVFNLVKNILKQSYAHEYVLFFDYKISEQTIDSLKKYGKFKVVKVKKTIPFLGYHFGVTLRMWSQFLDWMIFPANFMPFFYVGKSLLVIHDLSIYNHPEWFKLSDWLSKVLVVPSSIAKATKIVTISNLMRDELLELFKFRRPQKIKAVYPGILPQKLNTELAIEETLSKFEIKSKYLFFVGTIEPRKNLVAVMKAFKKVVQTTKEDLQLVIAGNAGWKDKKIFSTLQTINQQFGKKVINYIGSINDKEKQALFSRAQAFVFPSLYEGFGLPVLEAMSVGCPVVTSQNSAMSEFVKKSGVTVDPKSINDIFLAIKKILVNENLQKSMSHQGKILSADFSWSKSVKQLFEFIQTDKKKHNNNL